MPRGLLGREREDPEVGAEGGFEGARRNDDRREPHRVSEHRHVVLPEKEQGEVDGPQALDVVRSPDSDREPLLWPMGGAGFADHEFPRESALSGGPQDRNVQFHVPFYMLISIYTYFTEFSYGFPCPPNSVIGFCAATAFWRWLTLAPRRRTGRFRVSNSARSSRAVARITSSSVTWVPRVRSRMWVTNPSNRILIPTVRNRTPCPFARSQRLWTTESRVSRITAQSVTSRSNVRSTLIDFGSGRSSTGISSIPRAIPQSQTAFFPNRSWRSFPGYFASSPIVLIPIASRTAVVFGPTPLIFETGRGARNSGPLSGVKTVRPSGLFRSEAIFAALLFGAIPIEHPSPSRSMTAFLISFASSTAFS